MMHKTTMVVNDRKLARVRKILGTKGIRDTFEAALDDVIATRERAATVQRLLDMEGVDLDVLRRARKEAWR